MQAKIEMDDVPMAGAEPLVKVLQTALGLTAVGRGTMDIGLSFEQLPDLQRVAHGNGVADQEHARQARHVLDWFESGINRFGGRGLALAWRFQSVRRRVGRSQG